MSKWINYTQAQKDAHRERKHIRWAGMGEVAREKQRAKWREYRVNRNARNKAQSLGGERGGTMDELPRQRGAVTTA